MKNQACCFWSQGTEISHESFKSLGENLSIPIMCCNSCQKNAWLNHFGCEPKVFNCGFGRFDNQKWQPEWFVYAISCHELQMRSGNGWLKQKSFLRVTETERWSIVVFFSHVHISQLKYMLTALIPVPENQSKATETQIPLTYLNYYIH